MDIHLVFKQSVNRLMDLSEKLKKLILNCYSFIFDSKMMTHLP